ncbi:hypothetical protein [Paracidovorax anthurii]|uniref:DUF4124 domain-containing protein n=1 Tax=Paracidovorax anthurii TaxID=78229 RepID=A0A328YYJ5_9BURK|nr:hypothetical protein [Paracidovorax anthurii]RAR77292.1 hypothetical protein AX018_103828 [Paracidovorax anthurii]
MTPAFVPPLVAAALCCALPVSLWAQTRYSCRDSVGNTFTLSRPCPAGTVTTAVSAGPQAVPSTTSQGYEAPPPVRTLSQGHEYEKYMGNRCRSLNDTIRSGHSRGLKHDVLSDLRREYERNCRDEESEAASRYGREQRDARQQRREAVQQAEMAARAEQESSARRAEQCAESRRILAVKRARTDLSEGEKKDLKRFEEAFASRCQR